MSDIVPGQRIDDFEILEIAGRGGMGVVYRARQVSLDRTVAFKLIGAEITAKTDYLARFAREARVAAAVEHPHVVSVHGAGRLENRPYIVMQWVEGSDLRKQIEDHGAMDPERTCSIATQIASALDALHERGLVHRDLKPANVLLRSLNGRDHVWLTDFGIAKFLQQETAALTKTGAIVGSPGYIAPECIRGDEGDHRSDVYALGCVLFECLAGEPPFIKDNPIALYWAHANDPRPGLAERRAQLGERFDAILTRAMAIDPRERFQSATELAEALQAALHGGSAAPAGPPRRAAVAGGTPPQDHDPGSIAGDTVDRPSTPGRASARTTVALPPPLAIEGQETPFVGRREIMDVLTRRYELVKDRRRQFVVLCGEPGVGKTRLAGEFARHAYTDGATVLYGRSDAESIVPYQPFITALQHCLAHYQDGALARELDLELSELGRFIPALHRNVTSLVEPLAVEPEARRYRLFEAVTRVLTFVAADRPVVLLLDDLHWADTSTALLLRYTVQQLPDVRLLLVGTMRDMEACRSEDLVQLLARLRPQPSFARLSLRGLDAAETTALVGAHQIGGSTDGFVRRLRHTTGGNPLFIGEMLKSLSETESLSGDGVLSERVLGRIGVPEGAKEMITQRVLRLSEATRQVLSVASVIGAAFNIRVLEAVMRQPADRIISTLEEAEAAGLVREVDEDVDRLVFSHALVREALREEQSASRRARLHHRIGEALELVGGPSVTNRAELAYHFFESRHVDGAHKAVRYCLEAGDAAAQALAHEDAGEYYRRALLALDMQEPQDERRRGEVLLALGAVELRQGDPAARETFARAAVLARRQREPEQLARAALGFAGHYTEAGVVDRDAIALLEEALAQLDEEPSAVRARLTARLADALQFAPDSGRVATLSHAALVMARQVADAHTLVTALESRHTALLHIEHLDDRLRLSEEFLALADDIAERELKALGLHWRIYDLLEASDVAAARREHRALVGLAEELRQPLYHHFAVGWEVVWAQMAGRVSDSERLAREAFELGRQAQARDAEIVYAIQVIALRRREDRLSDHVSTIEEAIEKHPSLVAWRAVLPLAHLAAGNHAKALAEFERLAEHGFTAVPRDMFWFTAMCVLAEACALMRDHARAEVLYENLLPYKDRNVQVMQAAFWGSSERFLGLLAAAMSRWDVASEHFESAIAKNEASGCPVAAQLVRRDYEEMVTARASAVSAP